MQSQGWSLRNPWEHTKQPFYYLSFLPLFLQNSVLQEQGEEGVDL
jgi:hypothetical protein